jgi:hypothetical protein
MSAATSYRGWMRQGRTSRPVSEAPTAEAAYRRLVAWLAGWSPKPAESAVVPAGVDPGEREGRA